MSRPVSQVEGTLGGPEAPPRVIRIRPQSLNSLLSVGFILSAVLWRTWAVLQWTFQQDDWGFFHDATRTSFLHFVTRQYNGHFQPGQFTVVWLVARISPLNYPLAVAPVLIATFVGGVLMWRFLRELFGDRPANLLPLAVFMLCPLTLPPALWWAASLQTIPLQVSIVGTLFAVLRYVRSPSTARLVVVGLAFGTALLFWEKALLILPMIALFVGLFLGDGRGRERLRSVSKGRWRMWAVLGGVTVAYVGWYLFATTWQLTRHPSTGQTVTLTRVTVGSTIIPTFLGGPWSASPFGKGPINDLSSAARLMTWVVFAGIVGASLVVRRQAWRAWTLPVVYVGACIALVALSRLTIIGPVIGLDARYVADAVPVLALALALAFMVPIERRGDPAWAGRTIVFEIGSADGRMATDAASQGSKVRRDRTSTSRTLAFGLTLGYVVSAMVTNSHIAALSSTYSERTWFATVRSELAAHPNASVYDSILPARAIEAALFPQAASASQAFAPIAPHIRWNAPDEHMLIFDESGHLRPADVGPVTAAVPGPVKDCGYLAGPDGFAVARVDQPLFYLVWGVRVAYFTDKDHDGFVTVDGDRQAVRFLRGLHSVTLVHTGPASFVTIESPSALVCVGDIRIGDVKPLQA